LPLATPGVFDYDTQLFFLTKVVLMKRLW